MLGSKSGLGSFLVDSQGMTLYIFKSDTSGVSNCGADCASAWPPLTAETANGGVVLKEGPGLTGKLSVISRSDGKKQATYNGWPLYHFSGDKNPRDTNGQGIGGLWFVAPLVAQPPAYPTMQPSGGSGGGGGY
jgi:predicted lipoprotein with Yx(FWY)xxD motif